jgi:hypothetical protein
LPSGFLSSQADSGVPWQRARVTRAAQARRSTRYGGEDTMLPAKSTSEAGGVKSEAAARVQCPSRRRARTRIRISTTTITRISSKR